MKKYLTFLLILFFVNNLFSQEVLVSNDGAYTTPNSSSVLDVYSTTDGLLIPRMTQVQRDAIASPATGLLVFQTNNTPGFYYYDGTSWERFSQEGEGWALTGNSGTTVGTNFLGTTDAEDFAVYTNNTERIRVNGETDTYEGFVGIGTNSPTQIFHSAYTLDGSADEMAAVYGVGTGDGGATDEGIYGVYGNAVNGNASNDYGYGVLGTSSTDFAGGIGVLGSVDATIPDYTGAAGVVGHYVSGVYGILGGNTFGMMGQFNADADASTFGGYLYNTNSFNNSIDKYGLYSVSDGDNGTKYGVFGAADNTGASNYGIYGFAGNSGAMSDLSAGVMGYTPDQTGFYAVVGTGEGVSTTYFGSIGAGGLFNANSFGIISFGKGASGVGLWGIGANPATYTYWGGAGGNFLADDPGIYTLATNAAGTGIIGIGNGDNANTMLLASGSGAAFTGTEVGSISYGSDAAGTGVIGVGNGSGSIQTLISGSGGAFTGTEVGAYGYATNFNNSAGGYFDNAMGAYAYVGATFSWTNYKINGTGSVSTIVKDLEGNNVNMFCPEAPEILFQDYGSGKLTNGKAHINLDPIFSENIYVSQEHPLRVFIQLEGDCNGVYVTNKTKNGFDVVELQGGTSNVEFSWTVTANRKDALNDKGEIQSKHVDVRFPDAPPPMKLNNIEKQDNLKSQNLKNIKEDFNNEQKESKFPQNSSILK